MTSQLNPAPTRTKGAFLKWSAPYALGALLTMLGACGVPAQNDVVFEIMEASKGVVGEVVPLKTSKSLMSASLADAAQSWQDLGWQKVDAGLCKTLVPTDWSGVQAFDYNGAFVDPKSPKSYNLRLCATQLGEPKSIAVMGLVVSTQKIEPYKP